MLPKALAGADSHADGAAAPADARVRILVVDDRPENLLAVESVLRDPAYEVVQARSGAEALRFLLHEDCAVILLDVQMPEMDGFEVARLVRGGPRTRAIPIVFMTAVSRDERLIARGYQLGAIDYLLKPVDPHVLRSKVAALVELHRARQEIARQAALLRERERAERQRALEQAELRDLRRQQAASERYARLMDGITHAVVWSADPVTLDCTLVSKSTEKLLGRPAGDWTRPGAWTELVPAADLERFLATLRTAAAGAFATIDHGFVRHDGSVGSFHTELRVFTDRERDAPELRGFSVDVTEARRAEEALAFLARASVELFSSLDPREIARRLAGLAVPFLADACRVTVTLPDGEVQAAAPASGSDAEPSAGPFSAPIRVRGQPAGTLHLATSPGRRLGRRDAQLAAALAERAGQALENAFLYQEAQEAIQVREEFISVASHELRTPLTALTLQARLLERSAAPGGEQLVRRVAVVGRQVERLNRLVANLLDVTRLRVQRLELAPEPFDLCGLVEEVSGRFQEELGRARRVLRVSTPAPAQGIWDRTKLEQVVTNLVSNAIRYGGTEPIDVAVHASGGEVRISVQDRGRGIAPEDRARIFRRFERGQNAEGSGGLGLGLYVVRQIVEAHGGRIDVESELGAGATFTVVLPVAPRADDRATADAAATPVH
ncbi:MAG TPA: ATP-binding protein [Anaeromyxobacter sp.]|nr:ATP-binding protein [Anaeromyxobacter sp.]